MAKNLVIVESPAKVKSIKKFLGANYDVMASNGHVRDFPKSQFGIDVENDYEPKYITIRGRGELLAELRKAAKKADKIYLATDPDREGEAISWHLSQTLKEKPEKMRRITFNEITKGAVKASLKHARDIDMNLVDAQQTRRMLDRMVGYSISPLLWVKVKRGLSAGRVQSVALRLICDREDAINSFVPEEYWILDGQFLAEGEKKPVTARFYGTPEKLTIRSKEEMDRLTADVSRQEFSVSEVKTGEDTDQIVEITDDGRSVQTELHAHCLHLLRRRVVARKHLRGIAGTGLVEDKRDRKDPDDDRDHQQQAFNDVATHVPLSRNYDLRIFQ